jgi:hypothetical protein
MYYSKLSSGIAPVPSCRGTVTTRQPNTSTSIHYRLYRAEQKELEIHKWLESEKVGYDIGMERARLDWYYKHRTAWLASWLRENGYHLASH